jgi:ferredoxin
MSENHMADVTNKFPENMPGRYYVDDQCIDRDQSRETASTSFTRDEMSGHSFVFHQPDTPEEEALCPAAMQNCPVEAIGDNGA